MLLKLLKYELKASYARMLAGFAVYAALLGVLLLLFRGHRIISTFAIVTGLIALTVITFFTLFQRYNTNLYGDEGYLTFTLPVSSHALLVSKLLINGLWMFLLALFSLGAMAVLFGILLPQEALTQVEQSMQGIGGYSAALSANYLIEVLLGVIAIYFSISISKLALWHKAGVLMGFVTYFAINFLRSLPAYILMFYYMVQYSETNINKVLMPQSAVYGIYLWVQAAFDLACCIGFYFGTAALLNRKTNLK